MKTPSKFSYIVFRIIRGLVWLFYPRVKIEGLENLPEEPSIIVGNHSQMHGPIVGELYFPGGRRIWCAAQMMKLKEVPAYAFQDFWSGKPKWTHWFFKILSYIIAPLSACVFTNAHTIPVYHDARLISTYRQSITALKNGENVIIFPECLIEHNHIVYEFQDKFIDTAKFYYKRTGKTLSFVPMYLAPRLKTAYLGKPIVFDPDAPIEEERKRLCDYLMNEITELAVRLPRHKVVPYANLSPKNYPYNIPEVPHEKTNG